MPVLLVICCFAVWRHGARRAVVLADLDPQSPFVPELKAVTLVFGEKDAQPTDWSGSASISAGNIERIAGYHFMAECKVGGYSWSYATHPWTPFQQGMNPRERPQPHATPLEPVGVTIYYQARAEATLSVMLKKGQDLSFRPESVPEIGGIYPLDATVNIHRSPTVQQITDGRSENDFVSIATSGGTVWVAWQTYRDKSDTIFLRAYRQGAWGEQLTVTKRPGDLFMTAVLPQPERPLSSSRSTAGANSQLRARTYDGKSFSDIESVTSGAGNSLFHQVAADAAGNLYAAYQSWRNGRARIYLRSKVDGRWGKEIEISDAARDARANDWDAAVAVDQTGTP
jgi:hypothetical protein